MSTRNHLRFSNIVTFQSIVIVIVSACAGQANNYPMMDRTNGSSRVVLEIKQDAFITTPDESMLHKIASIRLGTTEDMVKTVSDMRRISKALILANIVLIDINGKITGVGNLPGNVAATLEERSSRIIPRVEFDNCTADTIILFLDKSNEEGSDDDRASLGLVRPQKRKESPEWLRVQENTLKTVAISCCVSNVNELDLLLQVAKTMNLELGILADGRVIFGSTGKWLKDYTPVCIVNYKDDVSKGYNGPRAP